jgi:hypothetical protein
MPKHYAVATLGQLLEASNTVPKIQDRTMVLRVANG